VFDVQRAFEPQVIEVRAHRDSDVTHTAVCYFDTFMTAREVPSAEMATVAGCCVWIACKYLCHPGILVSAPGGLMGQGRHFSAAARHPIDHGPRF
jgi:hypothetical protein